MNTCEYLDAAKAALGLETDYQLCKALGARTSVLTNYRSGRSQLDNYNAARIAEILGVDPLEVIADVNAHRENRPHVRKYWQELARQLRSTGPILILCGLLLETLVKTVAYDLLLRYQCILCQIVRKYWDSNNCFILSSDSNAPAAPLRCGAKR